MTQPYIVNHHPLAKLFIHKFSRISLQLFIHKMSKICRGDKGRTQHSITSHPPELFTRKRYRIEKEEEERV